jgi:prenyltransferase beta subunit
MSWQAASFGILALVLCGGFAWYERSRPPAKVLSLVAALAALAVVGRLAFAAIPNVKPTTDIVLFAGFALGAAPGFAVGAVTALVSNVFLSQGPWTAWQMVAWGGVGVGGALLARAWRGREPGRVPLALACGVAGLAFGAFMDVYQWTLAARQDLPSYLAVSGSSLPYNLAHAIGNVAFCLLIGPAFVRALRRYRRRFEVRWEPAFAAALAGLALAGSLTATPAADAATASGRAAHYLLRAQNRDGGFGAARGQSSSQLYTGWSALGLASTGRNPRDVHRRQGRSITRFLRRGIRGLRDIGELERTILVLRAAGLSPRSFAGRDLVSEILRRRRTSGSFAGYVSYTAFGILALKAARQPVGRASPAWLTNAQNGDGGFGVARGVASDTDMTGAALQALAAAGRAGGDAARRAVGYLAGAQNDDGGFGATEGRESNAQSTAYAVQGLFAVGAARASVERGRAYLRGLQRRDGSIRYSRSSAQTPVWATAQALMALRRRPLPLGTVPRAKRSAPKAVATAARARSDASSGGAPAKAAPARPAKGQTRTTAGPDSPSRSPHAREVARVRVDPLSGRRTPPPATREADEGGVSPLVLGTAALVGLILLAVLRRWLRRRRISPA